MKRIITSCLLMMIVVSVTAQTKINQFNLEGKRTGVWEKQYENGGIRYSGQFKQGKEYGVFKFYSQENSETPVIIKEYIAENNVAKVQFFTVKGVLQSAGELLGKSRIGTWLFYYESGAVSSQENYREGQLSGAYKMFYKNGTLGEFTHFKAGKLEGKACYYNLKGALLGAGSFSEGEKIGEWTYFEEGDPSRKYLGNY
ncbi:MAG: toxin-antitoxin system YwqK family antitoxin [Flavobacteriaceae bacterium]|nr:toxin-antitoxin system YwqK family antitoxin [Flavobacteriaceae bacterium]